MKISETTRKALFQTLSEAEGANLSPLELGVRVQDCLRGISWEQHDGELSESFVYRISDGRTQRLPLVDCAGRKLSFKYQQHKEKKSKKERSL